MRPLWGDVFDTWVALLRRLRCFDAVTAIAGNEYADFTQEISSTQLRSLNNRSREYTRHSLLQWNTDLALSLGLFPFVLGVEVGALAFFKAAFPALDALIVGLR